MIRGIPDYLTEETSMLEVRRAYPGENPVMRRLGVLDATQRMAASEDIRWVDWGAQEPDMLLSYRWSPDSRNLAIDTSDLYAKDRQIFIVGLEERDGLTPRSIARDLDSENETFYFWRIEWSVDSELVYFLSDRADDYHVWAVDPSGDAEARRLTQVGSQCAGRIQATLLMGSHDADQHVLDDVVPIGAEVVGTPVGEMAGDQSRQTRPCLH